MRAEPVWAYCHLWLLAQQVISALLPQILTKIKSLSALFAGSDSERSYRWLMIERRADVLKSEQLTLILKFPRRDVPIQQTVENNPFQGCPRGKTGTNISTRNPDISVAQVGADLPVTWTGRFLEVILLG